MLTPVPFLSVSIYTDQTSLFLYLSLPFFSLNLSCPPFPQRNFSSLSLNSNQSKPRQSQGFISRLTFVTASLVPGPDSPTSDLYLSLQTVEEIRTDRQKAVVPPEAKNYAKAN